MSEDAVLVERDDGTVEPLKGETATRVEAALLPLKHALLPRKQKPVPRAKPKAASRGDVVEAPLSGGMQGPLKPLIPGAAAPPKPAYGQVPTSYLREVDASEPKFHERTKRPEPNMPKPETGEEYKARLQAWQVDNDKRRAAFEARLRAFHAGSKAREERVFVWSRNPVAPPVEPKRVLPKAALVTPEDRVTRLCVSLLKARDSREVAQALFEAGHATVVDANRQGMLVGKTLTEEGREHALASVDDIRPKKMPTDGVFHVHEAAACPICGALAPNFEAHLIERHLHAVRAEHVSPPKPKKAPPRKAAKAKEAKKEAVKKLAAPKKTAKKPSTKKGDES